MIHNRFQFYPNRRNKHNLFPAPTLAACASVGAYLCLLLSACEGNITQILTPLNPTQVPTETLNSSFLIGTTPTITCNDGLEFLEDVTIPDGSIVKAGSIMDKQWLIQNSGTCNWNNLYRLHFINGNPMGSISDQALYPARSGTQAIMQIIFSAPPEPGEYFSEWQAFNANGDPFGESFLIRVVVQ
jgi:hypothetical protein